MKLPSAPLSAFCKDDDRPLSSMAPDFRITSNKHVYSKVHLIARLKRTLHRPDKANTLPSYDVIHSVIHRRSGRLTRTWSDSHGGFQNISYMTDPIHARETS